MLKALVAISLITLPESNLMADAHHHSLQLEVSDLGGGNIAVLLNANSPQAQRVFYKLQTSGASSTTHKGSTYLQANGLATLSTLRFSAGTEWCISLTVEEEFGARYTVVKGNACS